MTNYGGEPRLHHALHERASTQRCSFIHSGLSVLHQPAPCRETVNAVSDSAPPSRWLNLPLSERAPNQVLRGNVLQNLFLWKVGLCTRRPILRRQTKLSFEVGPRETRTTFKRQRKRSRLRIGPSQHLQTRTYTLCWASREEEPWEAREARGAALFPTAQ